MDRHVKSVLFDMDGVLIESRDLIERAWTSVAAKYDVAVTNDFIRDHIHGRPGSYTRDTLFQQFSLNERLAMKAEVDALEEAAFSPMLPGIEIFLKLLKGAGIPMALVTSSWRPRIINGIEMHGLHGVFNVIVDRDDVDKGKPSPQCYRAAASLLGLPPQNCLVLEDSLSGVQAAVASGATCLGIGVDQDLVQSGAVGIFPGFHRLIECLAPTEGGSLRLKYNEITLLLQGRDQ